MTVQALPVAFATLEWCMVLNVLIIKKLHQILLSTLVSIKYFSINTLGASAYWCGDLTVRALPVAFATSD